MKLPALSRCLFWSLLASAVLFSACRDEDNEPTAVFSAAEDEALASGETEAVDNLADDVLGALYSQTSGKTASGDTLLTELLPDCATLLLDSIHPDLPYFQFTIDFGEENCLCKDGILRRGRILVTASGRFREAGSQRVVTFQDYVAQDRYQIEGRRTVTSQGANADGQFVAEVKVENARFEHLENGRSLSWNAQRTRTLIAGAETVALTDNVYRVEGTASGTTFSGESFTSEINTPLRYRLECFGNRSARHAVSGEVRIESAGNTLRLDYDPNGQAACDRQAEMQFNDRPPRIISLR